MNISKKLFISGTVLLLSSGLCFSALASTPAVATDAVQEVVKQTTGDMAKEAASGVVDSTKEKAIGMAKEHANKAVDAGMDKVTEKLVPTDKAVEAATEAVKH